MKIIKYIVCMATIRKAFLLVLPLILFSSCFNDLLEKAPGDAISSENMWISDYATDLGMAGVYNALHYGHSTGSASGRTLYSYDKYGITGMSRDFSTGDMIMAGTASSGSDFFLNVFKDFYTGIYRANDAIYHIPLKSQSTPEKKARYIAEAKILRAYFYFRLNQLYKGVPVYLEPVTPEELFRPRETEEQVWEVILADLNDAIATQDLPAKYEAGSEYYGHLTKGAAYALRGKVYLYLKKYEEAIRDFQAVRDAGYKLFEGSYADLFMEVNEQCDEMIFSTQYDGYNGYGSDIQFRCGTRSASGSNWNTYMIHPDLVDLYEKADGSSFDWNEIIPGYTQMDFKERQIYFLRDGLTEEEIRQLEGKGLDMSAYLPEGNEARIRKAYENRDPRLEATVITPYSTFIGVYNNAPNEVVSRFPYRSQNPPTQDLQTDTPNYLYYLYRKFVYEGPAGNAPGQTPNRAYCPTDFPIIRYADVLLMWAEALIEKDGGVNAEAISLINQVRARAGAALLNSSPATMVNSHEDLLERLRYERRVEFVNEGINFFDELRWGTWKEMVFYDGNGIKQVWGEVSAPYIWQGDYITTWPIPLDEIQKNPVITQNPGWGN